MEARGWLGLPLLLWATICATIALVWVAVWPAERASAATGLRLFLIRWGHALVWGLLAAMCLMKASGNAALVGWSNLVGLSAALVYLGFLGAAFVLR